MTTEYLWPMWYAHEAKQAYSLPDGRVVIGYFNSFASSDKGAEIVGNVHFRAMLLAVGVQYDRDDYGEPKVMGFNYADN